MRSGRQGALAVVGEQVGADVDDPLLDPAGGGDEHDEQPLAADRHELDVAHRRARQRRVLHDGDLAGQRREQAHGAVDDVVEVDGALEELGDGALLGGAHRLDGREPVDEEAVAGIGGHPPGAGVRGGDEPLLLERGHVVAHGRGRHAEVVALEQRLGADRLGGLDVVLDDGAQHAQPAVLAHHVVTSGTSRTGGMARVLALSRSECQFYGLGPTRANAGDRTRPSRSLAAVTDRYGGDVLGGDWRRPARGRSVELAAEPGTVVEDVETGWVGAVVRVEKAGGVHVVHLEDRHGRTKGFRLGPGLPRRRRAGHPHAPTREGGRPARAGAGGIRPHGERVAGRDRPAGQGRERVADLRRGQARRRARREGVGRRPARRGRRRRDARRRRRPRRRDPRLRPRPAAAGWACSSTTSCPAPRSGGSSRRRGGCSRTPRTCSSSATPTSTCGSR